MVLSAMAALRARRCSIEGGGRFAAWGGRFVMASASLRRRSGVHTADNFLRCSSDMTRPACFAAALRRASGGMLRMRSAWAARRSGVQAAAILARASVLRDASLYGHLRGCPHVAHDPG